MTARGAIIMAFFGGFFGALTMFREWGLSGPVLATAFLPFLAIAASAILTLRSPGEGLALSDRGRKAVMWSSIAEGLGLFLVSQVLLNLGRLDLLLPGMALVVGLHFLPIAWGSGTAPYLWLGLALIAAALAGAVVPRGAGIAGLAAAAALTLAAILAVLRDRRARQASLAAG